MISTCDLSKLPAIQSSSFIWFLLNQLKSETSVVLSAPSSSIKVDYSFHICQRSQVKKLSAEQWLWPFRCSHCSGTLKSTGVCCQNTVASRWDISSMLFSVHEGILVRPAREIYTCMASLIPHLQAVLCFFKVNHKKIAMKSQPGTLCWLR